MPIRIRIRLLGKQRLASDLILRAKARRTPRMKKRQPEEQPVIASAAPQSSDDVPRAEFAEHAEKNAGPLVSMGQIVRLSSGM